MGAGFGLGLGLGFGFGFDLGLYCDLLTHCCGAASELPVAFKALSAPCACATEGIPRATIKHSRPNTNDIDPLMLLMASV
jgi:hypothetical protein